MGHYSTCSRKIIVCNSNGEAQSIQALIYAGLRQDDPGYHNAGGRWAEPREHPTNRTYAVFIKPEVEQYLPPPMLARVVDFDPFEWMATDDTR